MNGFGEGVVAAVTFLSTFWMKVPSPTVATGGGSSWSAAAVVSQMQGWLGPVTGAVALISFAVAIARIAFTGQGSEARHLVRQVAAVGAGSLAVVAVTQLLITGGDAFSPWIIEQAAGGDASAGLKTLVSTGLANGAPGNSLGLWFIIFVLCALGSIVQIVFMLVRGAALIILMAFVPVTAAGTASEEGWSRFKRLGMIILGFALYKPVAAIIYAGGILLMTENTNSGSQLDIQNALYGLTIIVMAALALPAFIKFLMPAAAMGSSSAFSGAVAAGVVAGGAAIVATGGFGAAAGGGAGAAGGAGTSGAQGVTGASSAVPPVAGAGSGGGSTGSSGSSGSTGSSGSIGSSGGGSGRSWAAGAAGAGQSGAGHISGAEPDEGAA